MGRQRVLAGALAALLGARGAGPRPPDPLTSLSGLRPYPPGSARSRRGSVPAPDPVSARLGPAARPCGPPSAALRSGPQEPPSAAPGFLRRMGEPAPQVSRGSWRRSWLLPAGAREEARGALETGSVEARQEHHACRRCVKRRRRPAQNHHVRIDCGDSMEILHGACACHSVAYCAPVAGPVLGSPVRPWQDRP